jgi:hypothetical protein
MYSRKYTYVSRVRTASNVKAPLRRWPTSTRQHGAISQKAVSIGAGWAQKMSSCGYKAHSAGFIKLGNFWTA